MKTHYLLLALLCSAVTLLQGCSNDDLPAEKETDTPRASLSIGCALRGNISRATSPTYESGSENEDAITSAYVIIYDTPLNASEANASSGKVVKVLDISEHLNALEVSDRREILYWYNGNNAVQVNATNQYVSKRYSVDENWLGSEIATLGEGRTLYAIALANIDLTRTLIAENMTVAALRDYKYTGDLYTTPASTPAYKFTESTNFVMSGINECRFNTTPVNGKIDLGTLMVQRLAARIDIAFGDQAIWSEDPDENQDLESYVPGKGTKQFDVRQESDGSFKFPIYDELQYQAGNGDVRITGAYFYLWDIQILNPVDKGSYLFEHASGTPTYLGNEGAWTRNASGGYFASNNIISVAKSDRTYSTDNVRILSSNATGATTPYTLIFNNLNIDTENQAFPFQYCSVLGYIGENTFDQYAENNKYTKLHIGGKTNLSSGHIAGATGESHNTVEVEIPIRHSFGAIPEDIPANAYGVVRNTIYRIYVKFYAQGDEIYARYYYYKGNGTDGYTENTYDVAKLHSFILESNGTGPAND